MIKKKKKILLILAALYLQSCYREQTVAVLVDFTVTVDNEDYSVPARILLENKSAGADKYRWTFAGGEPSSSDKRQPEAVFYNKAGTYIISLEAWNIDEHKIKEYSLQLDSAISIGFDLEISVNNISPVQALIANTSKGGTTYRWTFEGGQPSSSELYTPPTVKFVDAGEHTVILEMSNGRETLVHSETFTVLPAMALDFSITPSFEDEDMEAPFTATLKNNSSNGLNYTWTGENGLFSSNTASDSTTVSYACAGTYAVTLKADNGKEIKSISKEITVKPNSNIYIMQDVKLGIKSAHATIGSFYSCALRSVVTRDEVSEQNAHLIDFAFFGLDGTFRLCRFLSPDSLGNYAFYDIPKAGHTAIINTLENSPVSFSVEDFDSMTTDAPLHSLPVAANDSNEDYFTDSTVPRIALFETADRRKGAIKIKSFVSDGVESYILADIKVYKKGQ
ncbi:MAG: PKD domain-containing protein [Prevotellaceae bacterium]|jgi:PKD repeat protein|nr:PKD domain-containing protein [Prevotellaceae bacterium]